MEYKTKWIVTGDQVEVYKNSVGIRIGKRKHKKKKTIKKVVKTITKKLNEFSVYRTRRAIKWRINSNPDMNKFLTLTFAENLTDLKSCNEKFKAFIRKLKMIKDNLKYLVVPEFQKRGAVHYHALLNLDYIDQKQLANLWGHGFIKIKNIKDGINMGLYVSKYIGKDLEDERYFNNKKYFCSRNLDKPQIFYSRDEIDNFLQLNSLTPTYEKTFQSYYGLINYQLFKLDSNKSPMIE